MVNINSGTILSNQADMFFNNIRFDDKFTNQTSLAIMRYLIYRRLENSKFHWVFTSADIDSVPVEDTVVVITEETVDVSKYERDATAEVAYKDAGYAVQIYISNSDKKVVIMTDSYGSDVQIITAALLPRLCKWLFEKIVLSDDERNFIIGISEQKITEKECKDILDKFCEQYPIQDKYIHSCLDNFTSAIKDRLIRQKQERYDNYTHEIENIRSRLGNLLRDWSVTAEELKALKYQVSPDDDTSIADLFIINKNLRFIEFRRKTTLRYTVTTNLDNYSPDIAEDVVGNKGSYLYQYSSRVIDLFKAIFVDETVSIKFYANWQLGIGGTFAPIRDEIDNNIEAQGYLPNPHLVKYGCMGSYETTLCDKARGGEYESGILTSVVATGSLNLNDTPVMETFCSFLDGAFYSKNKYFHYKEKDLSAEELLEILEKEEKSNEKN